MLINQSFGRKYIKTHLTKQKMVCLLSFYTLNTVQLSLGKYYCFAFTNIRKYYKYSLQKLLFVSG